MTFWDAIILGLVQGLTEFLPISSSGHLVLFQHLFGLKNMLPFDVLIHFGTLLAVIVYYRRELYNMALSPLFPSRVKGTRRTLLLVVISSVPTAAMGLGFKNFLEGTFDSLAALGVCWLLTAGLLFAASRLREGFEIAERMTVSDALLIGLFQGISILPAVSRSGATIVAGMLCGLRPREAANFSFLLSIPAILGANLLEFKYLSGLSNSEWQIYILGAVIAAISGYAAIWAMIKLLQRRIISPFAWYCVFAAFVVWILLP